ncbi:restriction endonuclease subunit S [Streptomyces sp. MAR25Y5]|uniref:restriction endonuclease subunit S n=1 Tax=Streptomyces sp. MAR25Y5 TaxID=2962028 RepID=UPI0020B7BB3E|nr:restriction endonuclease subunit S [Streptomyces sp. MAR25Y5]MCP3767714.1 restriction endonuclease subunit S [Streptomyces sp. MAR25Y5]
MTIPLKYVARISAGQSPPSSEVADLTDGLPFLQGNAEFRSAYPAPRLQCNTAPRHAQLGDVLLSVRAPVGALNIADQPYGIGRGLCAIRASQCDAKFLWWWLHSQRPRLDSVSTGTTYKAVTAEDVGNLPFPSLSITAQRRIADFLDAEASRIDRLVSLRNRQLQLAVENRGSTLDAAFRQPEHRLTRLKYLLRSRPRYGVLVPQFVDQGIRFIRVNDLLDLPGRANSLRQIPTELSAQYSRTTTQPGDVLLSVVGTMGRSAIVPPELEGANVARAVASLRPNLNVPSELISIWLTTPEFMRQATEATSSDTAQPTLGMEDLSNFELSWPESAADLAKLLHVVRAAQQHYHALTRVFHAQSRLLLERRQALITAAVTGQFDVSTASGRNVTEGVAV